MAAEAVDLAASIQAVPAADLAVLEAAIRVEAGLRVDGSAPVK